MGYKLQNFNFNGLNLQDCYTKINECRAIYEGDKVYVSFEMGLYVDRESSLQNNCLASIYQNGFYINKTEYDTDLKKNLYDWLNVKKEEEGSRENRLFKDAKIL